MKLDRCFHLAFSPEPTRQQAPPVSIAPTSPVPPCHWIGQQGRRFHGVGLPLARGSQAAGTHPPPLALPFFLNLTSLLPETVAPNSFSFFHCILPKLLPQFWLPPNPPPPVSNSSIHRTPASPRPPLPIPGLIPSVPSSCRLPRRAPPHRATVARHTALALQFLAARIAGEICADLEHIVRAIRPFPSLHDSFPRPRRRSAMAALLPGQGLTALSDPG